MHCRFGWCAGTAGTRSVAGHNVSHRMSAPVAAALPALRRDLHQGPCQVGVSVPCRRQARKHDSISVSRRRGTQGSAAIPRQGPEWVEGSGPARDAEHLPRRRRGEPGGLVNRAGAPGGFEETGPFLGGEIFVPALVDLRHGRVCGNETPHTKDRVSSPGLQAGPGGSAGGAVTPERYPSRRPAAVPLPGPMPEKTAGRRPAGG